MTVVEPDLTIEKVVDEPFVAMGESTGYTVTIAHSAVSSVDAFDVVVEDPFDAPFMILDPSSVTATIVGATGVPDPAVAIVGSGFRVTTAVLPMGASLVITFNAEAQVVDAANGAASLNTAALTYDTIPGVEDPDEQRTYTDADNATVVIAGPDLRVIKDASQFLVEPGETFSYAIQVLNKGAPGVDAGSIEQARSVVLSDTLPEDVELLAVTVDGAPVAFSVDPATRQFTIALGTLDADQTVSVVLTTRLADPLSPVENEGELELILVNTATATLEQPDPTPEDNTDTADIVPFVDGRPPAPDLVVTKTNAVEAVGGKDVVAFTISASNVGERVAADVLIVDRVDMRVFEFVSASSGGVFDAASGTVTWRLGTLSPNDGVQNFTMVLRVRPGLSPSVDQTTNFVGIDDNGFGGQIRHRRTISTSTPIA